MTMPIWQELHEMVFENKGKGYIEWYCPACQRRLRFFADRRPMKIITPGDLYAAHYGSHGLDVGMVVKIESDRKGMVSG
jgi:hypothetical protein